ncbi:MAG: riboflavin biosynthesis protein RibF, partial [Terrimicrobiaceae bacterium]|nr:riboflavin biosynthesis protein RibF [Terrimicrobiaceae bacterium]
SRPEELAGLRQPLALAVGVFDGVHLGHQAVLERTLAEARACGGTPVAVTFHPHPTKVLRPAAFSRLLTSTPHKLRIIGGMGFGHALVIAFDQAFASTPAPAFIEALHRGAGRLEAVVVGCGWRFGKNREGTVDLIREMGARRGFRAVEIPAVSAGSALVSSTRIREAIREGRFEEAHLCLGRPYTILGTVVEGRKLGRSLGFPTANLSAHNEQFPPDGVYVGKVVLDGQPLRAVINIGFRPTFSGATERTLEVHIPGFHGSLYGRDLEVEFLRFLRPERKFASVGELAAQIARDVEAARQLENSPKDSTLPA